MSLARLGMLPELLRAHRCSLLGALRQDELPDGMQYNSTQLSCGCWGVLDNVRRWCIRITDDEWFERGILIVICVNCVTLALDDPTYQNSGGVQEVLNVSNWIFLVIFTAECTVKIVALGFAAHHGAYLRSAWNVIDFTAVAVSLMQQLGGGALKLTVLRALRVLRPLRMVSRLKELRVLIQTLVVSLPLIADVFLLLGFLVWVSSVLGVQLWAGALHQRCYVPAGTRIPWDVQQSWSAAERASTAPLLDPKNSTLQSDLLVLNDTDVCGKGHQCAYNRVSLEQHCSVRQSVANAGLGTFDNVAEGALLVLKVSSLDDWPQDMHKFQQHSGTVAWFYFGILTLFGHYFAFNLVLAVLSAAFSSSRSRVNTDKPALLPWVRCHHAIGASVVLCLEAVACAGARNARNKDRGFSLAPNGEWSGGSWESSDHAAGIARVVEDPDAKDEDEDEESEDASLEGERSGEGEEDPAGLVTPLEDDALARLANVAPAPSEGQPTQGQLIGLLWELPGRKRRWAHRVRQLLDEWDRAYSRGTQSICVNVTSAHHLVNPSKFSAQPQQHRASPYCVVAVHFERGKQVTKCTEARASSRNPVWHESMHFLSEGVADGAQQARVVLSVYDRVGDRPDTEADTFLGQCTYVHKMDSKADDEDVRMSLGPRPRNPDDNWLGVKMQKAGVTWGDITFSVNTVDSQEAAEALNAQVRKSIPASGDGAPGSEHDTEITALSDLLASPDDPDVVEQAGRVARTEEEQARANELREQRRFMRVAGLSREVIAELEQKSETMRALWLFIHGYVFVTFFIVVTLINVAALSIDHYPASDELLAVINGINFGCTVAFIFEAVFKISVMHCHYFGDGYNIFDFILVLFSLPDLFVSSNSSQLTVLRVLRLMRAFKLLQKFPSLRQVMDTVVHSVSQVFWLFCLVLLFVFIFGVLGMHLFGSRFEHENSEDWDPTLPAPYNRLSLRDSFASFWESLLTVFVITTGEGWGTIMWQSMDKFGWYCCFYFVAAIMLGNCVFLNLFVAILVDNCDRADERQEKEEKRSGRSVADARVMELERIKFEMAGGISKVCGDDEKDLLCVTANSRAAGGQGGYFSQVDAITARKRRHHKRDNSDYGAGALVRHPRRGIGTIVGRVRDPGTSGGYRWKVSFADLDSIDGGEVRTYNIEQLRKLQVVHDDDGVFPPDDEEGDGQDDEVTPRGRDAGLGDRRGSALSAVSSIQPVLKCEYQPSAVERVLGPSDSAARRELRRHLASVDADRRELLAAVPARSHEQYDGMLPELPPERSTRGGPLDEALRRETSFCVPKSHLMPDDEGVTLEDGDDGVFVVTPVQHCISVADVLTAGMRIRAVNGCPVETVAAVHREVDKCAGEVVEIEALEPSTAELLAASRKSWKDRIADDAQRKAEFDHLQDQALLIRNLQCLGYGQGAVERVLRVGVQQHQPSGDLSLLYKDWRPRLKTAQFGHKKGLDPCGKLITKLWNILREEPPTRKWDELPGMGVTPRLQLSDGIPAGDIEECRRICLDRGHGGFLVKDGQAFTIPVPDYMLRKQQSTLLAPSEHCTVQMPAVDVVLAERALRCFGSTNCFRRGLSRFIRNEQFDAFVTLLIAANMVAIAVDTPQLEDERPGAHTAIQYTDTAFAALFMLECASKIVVYGFYSSPHAYCRDKWNVVDMIVAVSASASVFYPAVRFIRALRTIRLIVRIIEVRLMVEWLVLTLPRVAGTVQLLLFFIFTWAVLGVQFFKGMFGSCSNQLVHAEPNCTGTYTVNVSTAFGQAEETREMQWERHRFHFDNTGAAMFTLFVMALGDGWGAIMYAGIDSSGANPDRGGRRGPVYNSQPWMSLYFVVFVVVGQFFLMNLFVGVLLNTFVKTKDRETGLAELSNQQIEWIQAQRLLLQTALEPIIPQPPTTGRMARLLQLCHRLSMSERLESWMTVCILTNAMMMSTSHYQRPALLEQFGDASNIFFVVAFTLEVVVKVIGMTPQFYFRDNWNRFDFSVVAVSLVSGSGGPISVLRLFRVLRLVRLLNKTRGLRALVNALIHSLPHIWNVSLLLLCVYFMFGIAGVQLFGRVNTDVSTGAILTRHANFRNIFYALITLYQISSTEGWTDVMHGTMIQPPHCDPDKLPHGDCGAPEWVSRTFFILFMVVGSALVLNLFVTVIVERYNDASEAAQHSGRLSALDGFIQKWRQQDPTGSGLVDAKHAIAILETLPDQLWSSRRKQIDAGQTTRFIAVLRELERMCVPVGVSKSKGYRQHVVRFNDVVSCLAARIYNLTGEACVRQYQWKVNRDPSLLEKLGRGFDENNPDDKRTVHPLCAAFAVQKLAPWQLRGPGRYYELQHLYAVSLVVRRMRLYVTTKQSRLLQKQLDIKARQQKLLHEQLVRDKNALQADCLMLERSVRVLDSLARHQSQLSAMSVTGRPGLEPPPRPLSVSRENAGGLLPDTGSMVSASAAGPVSPHTQWDTPGGSTPYRGSPSVRSPPSARPASRQMHAADSGAFEAGDVVEVWYPGSDLGLAPGRWRRAQITATTGLAQLYDVTFEDGQAAVGVSTSCIRRSESPPANAGRQHARAADPAST
eukprot:TRINITY_DN1621_c0_g1_i2.p1 TRINITY_DN1621_c0_g1~~TRINITY_DN1621_c0_g1_i2.p1  ORF type:complete len:2570 (+),score=876.68 TRINITY_DN1621_c0_g1_i2:81-7790(+)